MIIRFRSASVITESSNHPHPNNDDLVLSGFLADAAGRKWVSARFSTTAFGDGPADFLKVSGAVSIVFIHFLSIPYAVVLCVCVCSPGDAGRHWSSGLGMDGFPSFPHPMFMSIYVNDMSTGVFFAHHIAIRIPFR